MADVLLSASLQLLFERLASQEVANFILRRQLSQDLLDNLKRKFLVVLKALNDAEVKQFSNDQVKDWLVQVKDAVYDAEDLLDEIATDALRCQIEAAADSQTGGSHSHLVWNKFSDWVKAPFSTQSMEWRVKEMIAKLEAIALEKVELGLKEGGGEKFKPPSRLPSTSLVDESYVYGSDDIKKEMMNCLLSDNNARSGKEDDVNIDVICIVGMAGSGKTTLAQLLYNDVDKVKEPFRMKAWVCISTDFHLLGVTKSILTAIGCGPSTDDSLDLLQRQLKEKLINNKFLLVLDDVWAVESFNWQSWDRLQAPLLGAAQGSKIVVTTRDESVAKTMRAIRTHRLGELSLQHCWSLFEKIAFRDRDSDARRELEPIGRKIVDKCQRLPLAVKSLAHLLCCKDTKQEWQEALDSEIWHVKNCGILPSLRLSYHHLSQPVKHCFVYCSVFPPDHQFDKEQLILLWMAEGLLHPQQSHGSRERMEKIGESYFDQLLAKGFFQKSIRGEESCFVMHDLIHELAQHVSGEFCVRVEDDKVPKVSDKARHCLYNQTNTDSLVVFNKFGAFAKAKSVRTILDAKLSFEFGFYSLSKRLLHDMLPKMRCLRVLSLCEYDISDLPESIGNLKYLRYLDLSYTDIGKLPESVCCLYNLQTMILRGCRSLTELPSRMGNLINLRYLDLFECSLLKEMSTHGIGRLTALQRLTRFVVCQMGEDRLGELGQLSEIRGTLHISNMDNVVSVEDASRAQMGNKRYLDKLILEWEQNGESLRSGNGGIIQHDEIFNKLKPHPDLEYLSIRNYPGVGFPNWLGDPPVALNNLVSLELRDCGKCSTLPPLGNLTQLKDLLISGMNEVKTVGSEFYGNGSFESLKALSFGNMEKWEIWLCSGELFPRLKKLSVLVCPKLIGKLPEHLPSLEELEIDKCPRLVMASLRVNPTNICKLKMVDFGKLQLQMPNYDLAALQTSEIGISNVCQWKQLPVAPSKLSIGNFDSVESLLEGEEILQTNIHDLTIEDCSFSRSLQKACLPSTTLKQILISRCSKLEFLLPVLFRCHLPVLQWLHIYDGVVEDSRSLSLLLGTFPKLTNFMISGLEGLENLFISIPEGDPTSLRVLDISKCPNLESMELHALRLECCEIYCCFKLCSLVLTHSSIKELNFRHCRELSFQSEILPSEVTQLLIDDGCESMESFPNGCLLPSSMTSILIWEFPNLKSLDSWGLRQLTSLVKLDIRDCPELHFSTGGSSVLQHLISLKHLTIHACPKLQTLTEAGFQHLVSLKELSITSCPMLQSLKKGLHHLTSLQTLYIGDCPKLKYLTKKRLPRSLSSMRVDDCPLLEKRCQFEKGAEWPYISHIPQIVINGELY